MEGFSIRGFELFFSFVGIKMEFVNRINICKVEIEKLKLEFFDFFLGLFYVLVFVVFNSVVVVFFSFFFRVRSV